MVNFPGKNNFLFNLVLALSARCTVGLEIESLANTRKVTSYVAKLERKVFLVK